MLLVALYIVPIMSIDESVMSINESVMSISDLCKSKTTSNKIKYNYEKDHRNNKKDMVGAGCLIIDIHTNRLLVVKGPEKWSLPKGHSEDGETTYVTAERETLEETSLIIKLKPNMKSKKLKKYLYYFVVLNNAKDCQDLEAIDKTEISEVKWCTQSELKKLDCNQQLKYFIQRWSSIFKYMCDNEKLLSIMGAISKPEKV